MSTRFSTYLAVFIVVIFNLSAACSFDLSRVNIGVAVIPRDLAAIQACRRTAYKGQKNLLSAAKSFCNADQIRRKDYICIIATLKNGTVVGTADLNKKTGIVNNVYVVEEARKLGIGQSLMEAIEKALEKPSTLKLTVYSSNKPAVNLYQKLGFAAPGINTFLLSLSSKTPMNFLIEMEKRLV